MRTVYKYPITITDIQTLTMPRSPAPRLVLADVQGYQPCLWFEVDPDSPPCPWAVAVFGTGHPISDDDLSHAGSFQHGSFVWHVYIKPGR